MSGTTTDLTILWRGSLESCNYACAYCPFAKTSDDRAALRADRSALERFAGWVVERPYPVSILITPWGEALIRSYYRQQMKLLSNAANVRTIAVQTNLSCSLEWLRACDLGSIALWTTYHPGETPHQKFLAKIFQLEEWGIRYSVGVVGLNDHVPLIETLRAELPKDCYLWVNAFKRADDYYSPETLDRLAEIDPLFELNNRSYASRGHTCYSGETVISVLADGTARRCHFVKSPIGNIFDPEFENVLQPRTCPAQECRCHIGYSHLKSLDIRALFGDGFLERRPQGEVVRRDALDRISRFEASGSASNETN